MKIKIIVSMFLVYIVSCTTVNASTLPNNLPSDFTGGRPIMRSKLKIGYDTYNVDNLTYKEREKILNSINMQGNEKYSTYELSVREDEEWALLSVVTSELKDLTGIKDNILVYDDKDRSVQFSYSGKSYKVFSMTFFEDVFVNKKDLNFIIEDVFNKTYYFNQNEYWRDFMVKHNDTLLNEIDKSKLLKEMEKADYYFELFGEKFLFNGLNSKNEFAIYYSINKLIRFHNDKSVSLKAIEKIKPFFQSNNEKIKSSAKLVTSVLDKSYSDNKILNGKDEIKIVYINNDFIDRSGFYEIWTIRNGVLEKLYDYENLKSNIKEVILSPSKDKILIKTFNSNKNLIDVMDIYGNRNLIVTAEKLTLETGNKNKITPLNLKRTSLDFKNAKWLTNDKIGFDVYFGNGQLKDRKYYSGSYEFLATILK